MAIAAIYDIHGNLPALEAVLDEIRREWATEIVVGGDVVPGPMPRECLAALLDQPIPVRFIRGNGECDVLALHRGETPDRVPKHLHESLRWVADALPSEHLEEIAGWPMAQRLNIPGFGQVLFCHATPRDDNELFTRVTPEERLRPVFDSSGASLVICGHTHMQFDRMVGTTRIVNAGSVGMPFGAPGAYWAMLGSVIEMRFTPYDLDEAAARLATSECPASCRIDVHHPKPEQEMLAVFEAAAGP